MRKRCMAWLLAALATGCSSQAGRGAAPHLEVQAMLRTGCSSGEFTFGLQRSGLAGGRYLVRTEVTIDGLRYMDERAVVFRNGSSDWRLFDDHSFLPGTAGAAWPMPRGRPLRVDLALLRPAGQVLERQAFGIDGCDSGRLRFRTALMADGFE